MVYRGKMGFKNITIKNAILDQYFDVCPKFRFLTKISIFDQNFDF